VPSSAPLSIDRDAQHAKRSVPGATVRIARCPPRGSENAADVGDGAQLQGDALRA
jgi:hypothetical protein